MGVGMNVRLNGCLSVSALQQTGDLFSLLPAPQKVAKHAAIGLFELQQLV